jgi:outer membrane protein
MPPNNPCVSVFCSVFGALFVPGAASQWAGFRRLLPIKAVLGLFFGGALGWVPGGGWGLPTHALGKETSQRVAAPKEVPFRRITLEQAYDMTLASDQSVQIAAYEIRKARLLPWSALARLGPQLRGNLSYDNTAAFRTTEAGGGGSAVAGGASGAVFFTPGARSSTQETDTRRAGLVFEQPLLDFSVLPAYRQGRISLQVAQLQYQATVRQTLFGVAQAYYDVLKVQSLVGINRQTVELAQEQLEQARIRLEVGQVARIDVLRAEASLQNARNALIESSGALESAQDTLSNILNLGGKTNFTLVEPAPAAEDVADFTELLSRAYSNREDFRVSALAIEQREARRTEVLAQYGPRVVARASSQWFNSSGSAAGRGRVHDGVVSVEVPFLTGGQREIDLRSSAHEIAQSRLERERTAKVIEADVKNAWIRVRTGRESMKALKAEVDASTVNYGDLQSQYQAGTATSLDVQVALRELNNSRSLLNNQVYDYQVALRDLSRAQALFERDRVQRLKLK